MTLELLCKIYEENDIPKDALLMSDSGWECCASDMDGVFYSKADNTVFITQGGWDDLAYGYHNDPGDCVLIYIPDKDLNDFVNMYNKGIFDDDRVVIEEFRIADDLRRRLMNELRKGDEDGKNNN